MNQPVELVFEEPPKRVQRSVYHPFLRALRDAPPTERTLEGRMATRYARVSNPEGAIDLAEREAITIASAMRGAAKGIGDGFEIISRLNPATDNHGVWARYVYPDPLTAAHEEASALIAAAQQEGRVIPAASTPIDDVAILGVSMVPGGMGEVHSVDPDNDPDPIGNDDEWEFPAGERVAT